MFKIDGYQFDSKLMFWDCFSIISFQIGVWVLYQYSFGAKLRFFGCPPLPLSPPTPPSVSDGPRFVSDWVAGEGGGGGHVRFAGGYWGSGGMPDSMF